MGRIKELSAQIENAPTRHILKANNPLHVSQ